MCILYTLHNIVYLLKDKIHNVDIVRVVLDKYLCWFILWADLDTQLIPLLCFFYIHVDFHKSIRNPSLMSSYLVLVISDTW